ncbi:MAG: hypothetical protein QOJ91_513 [Sphingomonadales bacterium]|jgi:hypothetical protein|nr:hypothetical protein [Sphingomonadales bacterium]
MLRIENLQFTDAARPGFPSNFAAAAGFAALASILYGCSGEPNAASGGKARYSCSSVRSEHRKGRELLARRVRQLRSAEAGGKAGPPRHREFEELMAEIERVEGRFAVRSKECVGE